MRGGQKKTLLHTSRVAVAAKEVNCPDYGAVSKNVPSLVKADAVLVHPIPRLHIRGRDHGRNIGSTGVVDIIEPEKIQKNEIRPISPQ